MDYLLFASVIEFLLLQIFCMRDVPPTIMKESMSGAVAMMGQDVDLNCRVENLNRHMIAFIRSGSPPRLISFDEKIFRNKDKYELKPKSGESGNDWILTIKNIQESDAGNYSCQVNTDPVTVKTGYIEVKVPPSVHRSTPTAVEVREGHNVSLHCRAQGNPHPTVIWRRQDRQIIRYNGATGFGASIVQGPTLNLTKVSRKHMSEYVCVASNGIPPDESWTVKLLVTFPPLVQSKDHIIKGSVGSMVRLVCTAESWPRPDVTWEKDGNPIFDSNHYAMSQTVSGHYHSVHVLEIRKLEPHHYGAYRCVAKNDNGMHYADIDLKPTEKDFQYTNVIPEGGISYRGDDGTISDETRDPLEERTRLLKDRDADMSSEGEEEVVRHRPELRQRDSAIGIFNLAIFLCLHSLLHLVYLI